MKFNFAEFHTRYPWAATCITLVSIGVAGFVVAGMLSESEVAEAQFVCPADTECPYDSNGEFIGYKNAWPAGCITILPGAVSKPEKNMYNPTDTRASTTAPICRSGPVPPWRLTYYERGHRMRNVGTYIDRNGCAQKFQADGTPLGLECFPGTTSGGTTGTVAPVQITPVVAGATAISSESSFKYANSDTVYYLTRANCKKCI